MYKYNELQIGSVQINESSLNQSLKCDLMWIA